jgi:hypothetical protein
MTMMGSRSAGDGGWMLDGVVWCVVHTTRGAYHLANTRFAIATMAVAAWQRLSLSSKAKDGAESVTVCQAGGRGYYRYFVVQGGRNTHEFFFKKREGFVIATRACVLCIHHIYPTHCIKANLKRNMQHTYTHTHTCREQF